MQLLILLSAPPTLSTHTYASLFLDRLANPPKPVGTLTWAEILADEPFEGEHWDIQSFGSTPSLSPFGSENEADDEDNAVQSSTIDSSDAGDVPVAQTRTEDDQKKRTYEHRNDIETLQKRQYWREDHVDAVGMLARTRQFDLGDVSTLGPGFQRALGDRGLDNDVSSATLLTRSCQGTDSPRIQRYINESDAVREVLMALQGRKNIMMTLSDSSADWTTGSFAVGFFSASF